MDIRLSSQEICNFFMKNSDIVYIDDADGIITSINENIENLLGYGASEIIGKHFSYLIHPEDIPAAQKIHETAPTSIDEIKFTLRIRHKDGHYLYLEFTAHPIIRGGVFIGGIGVGRNITTEKIAEEALGISLERYEVLVNGATDIIYTVSPEGIVTTVNPFIKVVTGWNIDEVVGKNFIQFMHPEEHEYALKIHNIIASGQKPPIFELRFLQKSGNYLSAEFSITPLFRNGQFLGTLGIGRDVTERNKFVNMIKISEQRQKVVLNSIKDIAWLKDVNGAYLMVNETFEKIYGIRSEHIAGSTDFDIFSFEKASVLQKEDNEVIATGRPIIKEKHLKMGERETKIVEISIVPVFDHSGGVNGTVGIAHDITIRKEIEKNLRESLLKERQLNDMKQHFISMVSHEFRTPLTVIKGNIELLECDPLYSENEQARKSFSKVKENADRIVTMLNNIMILSLDEKRKKIFNPEPVMLLPYCSEIVEDTGQLFGNPQRVNLINSPDIKQDSEYMIDRELMRHTLVNLLTNAVKYSPDGRAADFFIDRDEKHLIFTVADRGIGIPEEDLKNMFQNFMRASNVGRIKGTGMGLAIVKKCVDIQGGSVDIESRLDFGTKVTVKVPILQNSQAS